MIYVLTYRNSLTEFLFCGLNYIEPLFIPVKKTSLLEKILKIFQLMLNKILKINAFYSFFPSPIYKKLRHLKKVDSLIYIGESSRMCFILSRICPNVKKIAFFWNPCSTIKESDSCIKRIKSYGFSVVTFDKADADRYNLIFTPQFYRKFPEYNCKETKNDFFFCGRKKNREKNLIELKTLLSSIGSCNFVIPESEAPGHDAMQYLDYVEEVKRSRVLCDINQKGQSGLTLRVLESLFFQKKLITNNINVKKYDFYNPTNILVFDSNTTKEDIQSFILKPYEIISDKILLKYEATTIFKELVNKA